MKQERNSIFGESCRENSRLANCNRSLSLNYRTKNNKELNSQLNTLAPIGTVPPSTIPSAAFIGQSQKTTKERNKEPEADDSFPHTKNPEPKEHLTRKYPSLIPIKHETPQKQGQTQNQHRRFQNPPTIKRNFP